MWIAYQSTVDDHILLPICRWAFNKYSKNTRKAAFVISRITFTASIGQTVIFYVMTILCGLNMCIKIIDLVDIASCK